MILGKVISDHKEKLTQKEIKKFKIDLILNIIKRLDDFSKNCNQCENFLKEITDHRELILKIPQITRIEKKQYFKMINSIISHLSKEHKLIPEGHFLALGISLGLCFGVPLGQVMGNISLGPSIGLCIGIGIGVTLDKKAKHEGRVI